MRISIDTEKGELEEIRHAIAILEDAIKRREDPDSDYEENDDDSEETEEEGLNEGGSYEEPESQEQEEPPKQEEPQVDMSALTMSDYGETKESRSMENLVKNQQETQQPQKDNKSLVKEIIVSLRNRSPGQPIQMSEIISQASEKSISEQDTRSLVSELQKEGSI